MPAFVRVMPVRELPPGACASVELAGRCVALFNVEGRVHALEGHCPHAGGPLGEGFLSGRHVTCPLHGWEFDVTTGEFTDDAGIRLRLYDVKVEDGDVYVGL
jgi:nitrite reductase (NADH) small subunit